MKDKLKRLAAAALCVVLVGLMTACGKGGSGEEGVIRVGSKDFTEGLIVSELYALALEAEGYQVERVFDIAGSVIHTALVSDEIDLYPEYTGTGLLSVLQMEVLTDPQEVYDVVKEEYQERFNLTWLSPSTANDGQGLAIRTEVAEELGIYTISQLQEQASKLRFASQGEFDEREDGLPALEAVYGPFDWASTRVYDSALKYEVLRNDEADVTPGYTTDGALADKETFTLLEDDLQVWPPYNLVPVVRTEVLEANPGLQEVLDHISSCLDTEKLTRLNARVDLEKEDYEDVARDFFETECR